MRRANRDLRSKLVEAKLYLAHGSSIGFFGQLGLNVCAKTGEIGLELAQPFVLSAIPNPRSLRYVRDSG